MIERKAGCPVRPLLEFKIAHLRFERTGGHFFIAFFLLHETVTSCNYNNMGKLRFLNVVNALTIAAGATQDVIKDIMRNDQVAGPMVFFTRTVPILAAGSHLHIGKFSTPHVNDANTITLHYERIGGKFKIGRTSTDTDLMAQTVYGDPDRTTFPSVQQFAEKALGNTAARSLLATTSGAYVAPAASSVAAIIIDQVSEQIEVMFSTTTQVQTGPIMAIIDLSDESVIHFAE